MSLERLARELRDRGGLLAGSVATASEDGQYGAVAAAGRRAEGREDEYALLVEAIREGYLLHYATGRLLRDDDRDLVLLAGDHLYALGLARLAALGDLPAVSELADVISLGAQAQAEGRADLAEAAWEAGAAAVGWGADGAFQAAKAAARAGAPEAPAALRAAARLMAGEVARVR